MKSKFNIVHKFYDYLKVRANTFSIAGIFLALTQSKRSNLKKSDVLFWCHDNHRIANVGGLRYSPLIDTIIDELGPEISSITLAGAFSQYYGSSCYGNVVLYNKNLLFAYIKRIVLQRSFSIKKIDFDPVVKEWIEILNTIKPKAIIGITPSPELCIAAKQLSIHIADMQHGILAPGNFYDLKKRAHIDQQGWPDIILCWDEFSREYVDVNLAPFTKALVIGHPGLFSKSNKNIQFDLSTKDKGTENIPAVLVTLNWYVPLQFEDDMGFKSIGAPSSLINFIKECGSFCKWSFRLHPAQINKRKNEVFSNLANIFADVPYVTWDDCNSETLHDSLSKSSIHVTYDSASTREAAMRGINTAILDLNEQNSFIYFGDLLKEGKASLIDAQNHAFFKSWIVKSHFEHINAKEIQLKEINDSRAKFLSFIYNFRSQLKQ